MKRLLKPGVGRKPFCQRDKFLVFVITKIRWPMGVQRGGRGRGKENVVVKQGQYFEAVTVDIAFGDGDQYGVQRPFVQHV